MALSQILYGGQYPGLVLKAWVSFSAAGAIIKSFNVASVTNTAAGIYTIGFSSAMASGSYQVDMKPVAVSGTPGPLIASLQTGRTASSFGIYISDNGTMKNCETYIAIYE